MAGRLLCHPALRRHLAPVAVGLSAGLLLRSQQRAIRMDAAVPPIPSSIRSEPDALQRRRRSGGLDPEVIRQLSGGSVAGFCVGLLVSVFSRTLVLLAGLAIITLQVASSYGFNLSERLQLKRRIQSSRILSALNDKAMFKLAFGTTFVLSAFMSF